MEWANESKTAPPYSYYQFYMKWEICANASYFLLWWVWMVNDNGLLYYLLCNVYHCLHCCRFVQLPVIP